MGQGFVKTEFKQSRQVLQGSILALEGKINEILMCMEHTHEVFIFTTNEFNHMLAITWLEDTLISKPHTVCFVSL